MPLKKPIEFIDHYFENYGLILKNGIIIHSKLKKDAMIKIYPIISRILEDLPIKHMYINSPVVIFRVSKNVLLVLLTKDRENLISTILEQFYRKFSTYFAREYNKIPKSLKDYVKFSIFTVARQMGPEPLGWEVMTDGISEDKIFKYSITSMMLLMDEVEGAKKRVLNFHPYVADEMLGIVYLFQIPMEGARGDAFDSSIMVGVDYNERALIYQLHYELEKIFSITADELIDAFKNTFKDDIQKPAQQTQREIMNKYLKKLTKRLNSLPIKMRTKDIKGEMVNSIKSLSDALNGD